MPMDFPIKVMNYAIGTIISWEQKMVEFGKKTPSKYKWEYCDAIPLLILLGVNNRLPLLHISKIFVYIDSIEKRMNKFEIVYMVKPKLNVNKAFREQVDKFLKETCRPSNMSGIRNVIKK